MFANSRLTLLRLTGVVIVAVMIALPIVAGIKGHFDLAANITQSGSIIKINASGRGVFADGLTINGNRAYLNLSIDTTTGRRVSSGAKDFELLATDGSKLFGELTINAFRFDTARATPLAGGDGGLVFASANASSDGILASAGDVHFYGGTASYDGQKANGKFLLLIFTKDFTDSRGGFHRANTGTMDVSATDNTGGDSSAPSHFFTDYDAIAAIYHAIANLIKSGSCAVARFEYLGGPTVQRTAGVILIWVPIALAALLRRRARRKNL